MKRKSIIVGSIFVLTLILLMPSIPAIQHNSIEFPDYTTVRGFGLFPQYDEENVIVFALFVEKVTHYGKVMDFEYYFIERVKLPKICIINFGITNNFVFILGKY